MKRYLMLAGIAILLLTACSPSLQVDHTEIDTNAIYTQSALTLEAMMDQPSPTAIPPTHTPEPTQTATQTPTPSATATVLPTWTPTRVTYCDWAAFVKDVSIPDETVWIQGTPLTKTWRLKNRGSCTWTPDYSLVFSHGAQMGASSVVKLTGYVRPGETVDVSVDLTVPETTGHYVGYWMLKNTSGILFGWGERANKPFFIDLHSTSRLSGSVTGRVCFPSEQIPPMVIYIQKVNSNWIMEVPVAQNQTEYWAAVEPGTYIAYAWTTGFEIGGAYTYADHTLRSFEVKRGITTEDIDICDWYGGPGSVPYPPSYQAGKVSGQLGYPSEVIPPLRVVAFNLTKGTYLCVDTFQNQQYYEIKGLTPGDYVVIAYHHDQDMAGGYTKYVTCMPFAPCEDHNLIHIHINAGVTVTNINPTDWYAPPGTFPPDPTLPHTME